MKRRRRSRTQAAGARGIAPGRVSQRHRLACAALAGALFPAMVCAQTVSEKMTLAWSKFTSDCRDAVLDPQAFVQSTPAPGPNGISTVATSPDGQILEARRFGDDQMTTLRVTGVPGSRVIDCTVFDQNYNAATLDMGALNDESIWTDAFDMIVRANETVQWVGGQVPIGFAAKGMHGEWIAHNQTKMHTFATVLDWDQPPLFATAMVGPGQIVFQVRRIENAENIQ